LGGAGGVDAEPTGMSEHSSPCPCLSGTHPLPKSTIRAEHHFFEMPEYSQQLRLESATDEAGLPRLSETCG
jgi:hypothetical protein